MAGAALDRAGNEMRTKEFLSELEHDRIVQAIREAESKTSGQTRVYIQRGKLNADPLTAAQKKFHRLGMDKTSERNAVLIFVAPRAHKFAVVGDKAIHELGFSPGRPPAFLLPPCGIEMEAAFVSIHDLAEGVVCHQLQRIHGMVGDHIFAKVV